MSNPFAHISRTRLTSAPVLQTLPTPSLPTLDSMTMYKTWLTNFTNVPTILFGNAFTKQQMMISIPSSTTKSNIDAIDANMIDSIVRLLRVLCLMKMIEEEYIDINSTQAFHYLATNNHEKLDELLEDKLHHLHPQPRESTPTQESSVFLDWMSYVQVKVLHPCGVTTCSISEMNVEDVAKVLCMLLNKGVSVTGTAVTGANTRVFTRSSVNYMLQTHIDHECVFVGCQAKQMMLGYKIRKQCHSKAAFLTSNLLMDAGWLMDIDSGMFLLVSSEQEATVVQHYQKMCKYL